MLRNFKSLKNSLFQYVKRHVGDISGSILRIDIVPKAERLNFVIHLNPESNEKFAPFIADIDSHQKHFATEINYSSISFVFSSHGKKHQPTKVKKKIPNVDKVIVVASGKGGVGKSTVAMIIATKLAQKGFRVGFLDADIYGPSIPHLINGVDITPAIFDNQFIPHEVEGIEYMSMGFLLKDKAPIWRGPLLTKALNQMLQARWNNLDYLIIDTPPGTGDIHLSLFENSINGAILVTTPHKLSTVDVKKLINLLDIMKITIKGLVINMAYIDDGKTKIYPFGEPANMDIDITPNCQLPLSSSFANFNAQNAKNIIDSLSTSQLEQLEKIISGL